MSSITRISGRGHKTFQALLLLLASPLFVVRGTGGQGVIANPTPAMNLTPPAVEDTVTENPMNVFLPNGVGEDNTQPKPFKYGMVTLRPHVDYSFSYTDGLLASPTNHQATAINTITAGLAVDLGPHWALDYTPTIRFYSNSQFKDGVDHALSLVGGTRYEDWLFGLSQSFAYSTAPTAETGTQTEQYLYGTGLTASHVLNDKLSLDLGLSQDISDAAGLQSSRSWSTMDWLNYQFWPRLSIGVGAGAGYVNEDIGPDQTFEMLQGRVKWRATDKLSIQLSGGGEDRQYSASSQPNSFNPTFAGAIQYKPFDRTEIALTGSRSISPSVIPGLNTTSTGFSLSLDQALFKKFKLDLSASYGTSKFVELIEPFPGIPLYLQQARTDDNYTLSARLSHPFLKRGTVSVFYQYTDNQSSKSGFGYRSNQVGFDLSYRY